MIGDSDRIKLLRFGDVIVICRNLLSLIVGVISFKLTPLLVQRGEFYQLRFGDMVAWIMEPESLLTIVFFMIPLLALTAYFFKNNGILILLVSSSIFGISFAYFEYPIGYFKDFKPEFDWVWIIAPYALSFTFLVITKLSFGRTTI